MPKKTSVLARAFTAVGLVAGIAITHTPAASADVARPAINAPFTCGQVWFSRTYAGHPRFAIDWNLPGGGEADFGQPVLAGGAGIATVDADSGYGNMVTIDHGNGWKSLYAHLSAVLVSSGQVVAPDTLIGRVGRTGRADGSHLHLEQSLNGVRQPIVLDGVPIVASFSSRGASHASGNCPPPVPVVKPSAAWAAWRCHVRCAPDAKQRPASKNSPTADSRNVF